MMTQLRWARLAWTVSICAGLALLLVGAVSASEEPPPVDATVYPGTLIISLAGGTDTFGNVAFGAVATDIAVTATAAGSPLAPRLTNSSDDSETISTITVEYFSNPEASCDGGDGSWDASATANGIDTFQMHADIGGTVGTTPIPVFGDSLPDLLGTTLAVDDFADIELRLLTPNPATVGSSGCNIVLTVTAS